MATTCKKCFAPLASTERVCHSCGTPVVEITTSSTWSGGSATAVPPKPVAKPAEPAAPITANIPGVTTTADPFAAPKRTASEIGAAVEAATPETPPVEPELPMSQDDAPVPVETPSETAPSELALEESPLPMPPSDNASPFRDPSVGLGDNSSVTEAVKDVKPLKSEKFPWYALIITAVIAIGLAGALIYTLAMGGKKSSGTNAVVESIIEPYPARIGDYVVSLPSGMFYTHNGTEAIFYDDSQAWSVYAQIVDRSFSDIEALGVQIVDNFHLAGYQASDMVKGTYGNGREYLTTEVINGESSMIVAYTTLDDTHSIAMSIVSASGVADYTVINNMSDVYDTISPAPNSPVEADNNGIDRKYVSNFEPYVAPEPPVEEAPVVNCAEVVPAENVPEALQTQEVEQPQ